MAEPITITLDVFNPHGKIVDELPFVYGFNNGGSMGFFTAIAISADGHGLGSHLCSDESFMPGDLGLTPDSRRTDRKETYQEHYPDGYRTAFISYAEVGGHTGLQAAFSAHDARKEEVK